MPDVPFPVGDVLLHPPLNQLEVSALGFVCSGDGSFIGDTSATFPSEFGLWWEFTQVPPGLGYLAGPTRIFHNRIVQWRIIHTLRGVDFVSQVENAYSDRILWFWDIAKPTRIEFSVLFGVTVNVHKIIGRSGGLSG